MIRTTIHAFFDVNNWDVSLDIEPATIDGANRIILMDTDSGETIIAYDDSSASRGHALLIELDRDNTNEIESARRLITTVKGRCEL